MESVSSVRVSPRKEARKGLHLQCLPAFQSGDSDGMANSKKCTQLELYKNEKQKQRNREAKRNAEVEKIYEELMQHWSSDVIRSNAKAQP